MFLLRFQAAVKKYQTGNKKISRISPIIVNEDSITVQITEKKSCATGTKIFQRGRKSSKSSAKGWTIGATQKERRERMVLVTVRNHFMAF